MSTPRIDINLWKIAHNAKRLKEIFAAKGIEVIGVTKAVGGNPIIAKALVNSGIKILADSRLANIKRMQNAGIKAQFMLLRSPFLSQVNSVIKHVDISLNSELQVIKKISRFAVKNNTNHKIILMIELGDLREGIIPEDLNETVKQILELKGIDLVGLGTNLACFGGVKPDEEKMKELSSIADKIEKKFKISLKYISGGNSANYDWFTATKEVGKINNLRIGESIYLGCETLNRKKIPGLFTDAFTLVAEVIESKVKPSVPYGNIYQDAFGNIPKMQDRGQMRRVILGIGKQDVDNSGLTPLCDIDIIASSSDHTIVNSNNKILVVGDHIKFKLNYGALLRVMTSQYISKNVINLMNTQEYCKMIERNSVLNNEKISNKLINEKNSPLVSLKESGFNIRFKPSFTKNYKFLVRQEIIEKIGQISKKLEKDKKVLIILSAWRSISHQRRIWENEFDILQNKYPNKSIEELITIVSRFIAPERKSMHLTGGAVGALIYDLNEDKVLDFGTNHGLTIELNEQCYPNHPDINSEAKKNRRLLTSLFEEQGFVCSMIDYWQFNFGNRFWANANGGDTPIYDSIYA